MQMIISWNDIDIVKVIRNEKYYCSVLIEENVISAIKKGMPTVMISNIKLISKRMPEFILKRIPKKEIRDEVLETVSQDEGENIINYINKTNCKFATDKFLIRIVK